MGTDPDSIDPRARNHLVVNPAAGGTPIMLREAMKNAAMVQGIFFPIPESWLISVLCALQ
jgi:hypothetical protein